MGWAIYATAWGVAAAIFLVWAVRNLLEKY